MASTDTHLKLIAIVLPEPLYSMIRDEQLFIAEKWGPKYALRTPPHITLIPPISVAENQNHFLEEISKKTGEQNEAFMLRVNGFEAFSPRVIFAHPSYPKALRSLYTNLRSEIVAKMPNAFNRYHEETFVPHITLAYRDLDVSLFKEMWRYYRNKKFVLSVSVEQFSILSNSPEGWQISSTYQLTGKTA